MINKKILKVGVFGVALLSILSTFKSRVNAQSLICDEISDDNIKYVNVSMWDINPERYNAMMRGIYPEEYYPINIPDREKIDKKHMLFGSTEGMCVGGIQNGFVGPNINRTCSGILQNLANKKLVNGNLVINSEYTNGSSFFPSGSVRNDVYVDVIQDWKFPFLKESNGYYSFNSDSLHVKRDYASKKFILHKGSRNGFYPFNNCEDNTFEKTNKNLYFTAKFEIPFYMNKDGKIKNSLTGQLEDMKFNFSGDDDVWIYVDDDLAVDLGGLHCKQTGNINFAKNQVIYSQIYNKDSNADRNQVVTEAFENGRLAEGKHMLRVFYMERAGGESNLFVNFNLQSSGVKVNHIEKDTNKILESELISGNIGTSVTTSAKEFENHILVQKPDKETFNLTEDLQTVDYYYDKNQNVKAKYIDILDKHELAPEENQKLFPGSEYKTNSKEIENYVLVKDTGNTSGKVENNDIEVTYFYQYNKALARANYIDKKTNENIYKEEKIGLEGEIKTFEEKVLDGYELVEKPEKNEVKLEKNEQEINYYYKKKGEIEVNYKDKTTEQNLAIEQKNGLEDDKVKTEEKQFEGYVLFEKPEIEEYIITREKQVVNYWYLHQSNIKINYIDKDTNEKLDEKEDIVKEGTLYKTEEKSFENYKLVEKPESEDYLIGKDDITVNYYYQKLKFNLKIDMNLVQAIINSHFYRLKGKVGKVEAEIKEANPNSKVKITYNVKVTNDLERVGGGKVRVQLPDGYIAMQEDNLNWTVNDKEVYLDIEKLNPGESVEYELVLTKNSDKDICEIVKNKVTVESNGIEETNLDDNEASNDLVIFPRTGIKKIAMFSMMVITGISLALHCFIKRIITK